MNEESLTISTSDSLAQLAVTHAGASQVFQRHHLDFCCGGHTDLDHACRSKGLDPAAVAAEIAAERIDDEQFERWPDRTLDDLIDHILTRYHEGHRAELPRLIAMAQRVEKVHGEKPSCPRGLAALLQHMAGALEDHMRKEEGVLFPLIIGGNGHLAQMPIHVMESEHKDHVANLARLDSCTGDYVPPPEACNTWRALYLGLAQLKQELMQHIHLENNVLFPRALRA